MKTKSIIFASALLAAATCLHAAPALITGTPSNSLLAIPTGPSPIFGPINNFDSLTPNSTFDPSTYAAQGIHISSPDGLLVLPFSTQSFPNELFDASSDGTANITISLAKGTNEVGIGIADADPVTITLQALNSMGGNLGSPFSVTLPDNTANPFNGYFAITDTSYDIFGLEVIQSTGNANNSGLAIDDLQVAPVPEPASLTLLSVGAVLLLSARLRKRA